MNEAYEQLLAYCRAQLSVGTPVATLQQQLITLGWSPEVSNLAIQTAQQSLISRPSDPHRVRNGVLWILSPFIVLILIALLQVFVHFVLSRSAAPTDTPSGPTNPALLVVNIISLLVGIANFFLLFAGPIIGIVKLTKK